MKVILTGATGMVGRGVLLECLDDDRIDSVLMPGRRPSGVRHAKVSEIAHEDFNDWSPIADQLSGHDACFWCAGVSSAGMGEAAYTRITHDATLSLARVLVERNPTMTFCYVSGAGADSSEHGRVMWARVRGRTENALLGLGFKAAYVFRPAYIQPLKGIRSRTRLYRALYAVAAPLYPLWKALFPNYVTTTVAVGRAMIGVAATGFHRPILETCDINEVATTATA